MKSTLYLKFILLYIILGFLSIFTVASLSSTLTTHYLESSISGNMYQSANLLASNYLPDYFSKTIALADVYTQLNGMSDYLNSDIWFVDNEGSLLASAKSGDVSYAPSRIENFDPAESGGSTYLTGDYHGYFNSEMITVIAPVTENFSTHGYLLVHKPYSQITNAHSVLMRNTYIVILIIYVLSFIILLGVHFLIYRPLVKITNAAKQYASGNLDVVIPVNTQDEIGYLSASLNYMSSQLKDMEDYQKKFVANVSHDFRSPLTSIKGYVEAMADGTIPPEMQGKYLNIILFETERLTDLTRDLLTLNEFDTKDLLLDKTDFDIHEVIRNTAASFEGTCTAKKISIELLLATRTLYVHADRHKIQQVLYNLLDNAIKFSNPESTITIETTPRGDKVYTSVKDYGIGIPKSSINKIWERFYKSDLSRGKDKKGTGLGLAIVKKLVVMMHGTIEIHSKLGEGTGVILDLPLTISGVDAPEKMPQAVMAKQNLEGRRVLLAEDNEINTFVARRILESKGILVEHAENGKRAVEMVEQNPEGYFDAIVMDIRMPVMDGLAATRCIRESDHSDSKTVPIVAMTANVFEEDVKKSFDAGMNAHLSKPVDIKQMYAVLDELVTGDGLL